MNATVTQLPRRGVPAFRLPPLPYAKEALEPFVSAGTLDLHYEKHHRGYVEKLNAAICGGPATGGGLEHLIRTLPPGKPFDFAAQAWNHAFYWHCMSPGGGGAPEGSLAKRVNQDFGSVERLKQSLAEAARNEFGSGWAWLVVTRDGSLQVSSTTDAQNPLRAGLEPLLAIDVWEHAYYLDYQYERERYIEAFLDHLVCWDFVGECYLEWCASARAGKTPPRSRAEPVCNRLGNEAGRRVRLQPG